MDSIAACSNGRSTTSAGHVSHRSYQMLSMNTKMLLMSYMAMHKMAHSAQQQHCK